jgi:hypothetical protein
MKRCLAALCFAAALPAADPLLFIYFREPALPPRFAEPLADAASKRRGIES